MDNIEDQLAVRFEDRIGISTVSMVDTPLLEAIKMVADAGFKVMEICVPDFQGVSGFPLKPAVGIWPRGCSESQRRKIGRALESFNTVILHAQFYGADIAAINPGIREESCRQYMETLELGIDLNVSHITYHHGSIGDVLGANGPERERRAFQFNIDMARALIEKSNGTDIILGYENTVASIIDTMKLIKAVDHKRFGLLMDMPHAVMANIPRGTEGLISDMSGCVKKIAEIHAHGLWIDACITRDHQDVRKNNYMDYGIIMPELNRLGYVGPLVFEISAPDAYDIIDRCLEFKKFLVSKWK